jgi:hypothetical protein
MATTRNTQRKKIREAIAADSKTKPFKAKRKRKPMTEEQKAAAAERLAKAREARMEKQGPPKNVHPDVLALPDDDNLSLTNVRSWIKTQKELLSSLRRDAKQGVKGAEAKVASCEGYIRNLDRYIRDGVYCDMFWGEYAENKMRSACIAMAYDKDGNPKRNYGTFYPDIGAVYIGPGKIERDGEVIEVDYV